MRHENFVLKEGAVRLSDCVKVREEYFGGIVFHKATGDTLEVDRDVYKLLVWLRKAGTTDIGALFRSRQISAILSVLLTMDIIEYIPMIPDTSNRSTTQDCPFPTAKPDHTAGLCGQDHYSNADDMPPDSMHRSLSAPETVHLAVTYQCGATCPDCYARRHTSFAGCELNTPEMCKIIDDLADNGIFQLAIGGGEPFVRPDLSDIVRHAANKGLVVHITTGLYTLKPQCLDVLKYIKSLHIGIRSEELVYDSAHTSEKLRTLVEYVGNTGISIGANIIMTRFTIQHIGQLMELLLECGFKRLIFLRYKPIADHDRWNNENPGAEEFVFFMNWLTRTKRRYPHLMLRIDCASAFLMKDANPLAATHAGLRGCTAGERIISVAPDGSVYPCSQLVGHAYNAGNLTSDSFSTIWHESDVLNKYRYFRQNATFTDSVCGRCNANRFYGGCRIFAKDFIGSEQACPLGT